MSAPFSRVPNQDRIQSQALRYLEQRLAERLGSHELVELVATEEFSLPLPVLYTDFLAIEYDTPRYRINHLWPSGGTALLSAYRKTGKSTMVQNIIHSLSTGEDFLGQTVIPIEPDESILHLNFEVDQRTQQYYARPFGAPPNAYLLNLRGQARKFNILSDAVRSRIARLLEDLNVVNLIADPLGPLLRTFGLDENKNGADGAGALVEAFNALVEEAHLKETLLVHHTGHGSQWRARGSSVFGDAPDVLWNYRLGRHKMEDPDSEDNDIDPDARYFSATGRLDSDFEEQRVYFDERSKCLSLAPSIL